MWFQSWSVNSWTMCGHSDESKLTTSVSLGILVHWKYLSHFSPSTGSKRSVAMNKGVTASERLAFANVIGSNPQRLRQFVNFAVAVGERVEVDANLVEQRQVEIGQRSRFVILDVTPALHPACRATGDQDRQVRVVMDVRIAYATAVKIERMIEQCAIPFRRGLQLPKELGKQRHMKLIDLGHARNFFRIIAVMRKRMMRIRNADLGVSSIAGFARELERDDARDITLQRQDLQVEHQSRVVGVGGRHAHRPVEIRQRIVRRIGLGLLNTAFDLPDGFEVVAYLGAITRSEFAVQARDVFVEPV